MQKHSEYKIGKSAKRRRERRRVHEPYVVANGNGKVNCRVLVVCLRAVKL